MAGLKRSIKRRLRAQMEKEFGESIYSFWKKTLDGAEQILSYETVARIMSEGRDDKKSVDFGTLLTICRALDFSRNETREIMKEHDQSEGRQQDRGLWKLIGDVSTNCRTTRPASSRHTGQ